MGHTGTLYCLHEVSVNLKLFWKVDCTDNFFKLRYYQGKMPRTLLTRDVSLQCPMLTELAERLSETSAK